MNLPVEVDARWRKTRNTFCSVCAHTGDICHVSINHFLSVWCAAKQSCIKSLASEVLFYSSTIFLRNKRRAARAPDDTPTPVNICHYEKLDVWAAWVVVGQRFIASARRAWMTFHIASSDCAELEGGNINLGCVRPWNKQFSNCRSACHTNPLVRSVHRLIRCKWLLSSFN